MSQNVSHSPSSNLWAYAQLVRAPNVFTALADVLAGFLVVSGDFAQVGVWLPLFVASMALYSAGMVLNDVYDVEVDSKERPHRPIPSGQVRFEQAGKQLGVASNL